MKTIYARERLTKSIFLAGPTPRSKDVQGWRSEALNIIDRIGFHGTVFVPEPRDNNDWSDRTYDEQLIWEWEALNQCTTAVFWIPRTLSDMPAFTTNVEFGLMSHTSKMILGYPSDAPKMRYLHKLADRYQVPVYHSLDDTITNAIRLAEAPFTQLA